MNRRFSHSVFLAAWIWVALGTAGPALAESPIPTTRGPTTMQVGAVNLEQGYAVIDDQIFLIAATTRVTRASGATGSLTDLRKGMHVTVRATTLPGANKPTLADIRIVR